jgi:hypothetical protein
MSQVPSASRYSLAQVLKIVAELQEQLKDDPNLTDKQRAAIEALLSYYLSISIQLERQVDSIMSSE